MLNCPAIDQSPGLPPYAPNDSSGDNSLTTYSVNCKVGRFITHPENQSVYMMPLRLSSPGVAARASATLLLVECDYRTLTDYPLFTGTGTNYYNDWGIHPALTYNGGMVDGSVKVLRKPEAAKARDKTLFYTIQ